MRFRYFLLFFFLLSFACGDDSETDSRMTGTYSGTWTAGTSNGFVNFELIQDGSDIRGTAVINGNPCVEEGVIWGNFVSETNQLEILMFDPSTSKAEREAYDPTMTVDEIALETGDLNVIKFSGELSDFGHLSMDFYVIRWGELCTGVEAELSMDRM